MIIYCDHVHFYFLPFPPGHFLFLPSSNRTAAQGNARLLSPHLPPTRGTCLRLWAYKPLSSDGELRAWRSSEGRLHQLLLGELGAPWRRFDVDITSAEEYQYSVGVDCANKVTDALKSPPKRDNAGGIAASVVVVLLLIGTLVALLVYYLRTKEAIRTGPSSPQSSSSPAVVAGFSNDVYESDLTRDRVIIPAEQNHPMAAGFNNVTVSVERCELSMTSCFTASDGQWVCTVSLC
ncbi:hypothetical protein EYF80_047968 [Liparis tanakae]|uniref:MAM domain-containing protein n=1 Tax=Liparis tanakae TaxID=230148 RepID=A0A4Z2FLH2_9TELE|nr:hypothetical protein EYF80_047968 [Liparis tanakae]